MHLAPMSFVRLGGATLATVFSGDGTVSGYDRYDRYAARSAPTGWRRKSLIGVTAAVLMTLGLLVAEATAGGAHAATITYAHSH